MSMSWRDLFEEELAAQGRLTTEGWVREEYGHTEGLTMPHYPEPGPLDVAARRHCRCSLAELLTRCAARMRTAIPRREPTAEKKEADLDDLTVEVDL